jgi:large subunit ribosomal protein L17
MRHRKAGRKFNRSSSHRKAMYSNMVAALVTHGRIETTEAKAKELRRVADRTINWGVKVADLLAADPKKLSQDDRARLVHARRMAQRVLKDRGALAKLFDEIAPQYAGRAGGYTRILKTRDRRGDAAPMAFIELVGHSSGG